MRPHCEESGEEFRDTELECEEEEARERCVLRDPGPRAESEGDPHAVQVVVSYVCGGRGPKWRSSRKGCARNRL